MAYTHVHSVFHILHTHAPMLCNVSCYMYVCLSAHASIMFQVYGSNVRGSTEESQVGRVA